MTLIGNILNYWESLGAFTLIIPFVLIFVVLYGLLGKTKLFEKDKKVNAVLSLTMALIATAMGYYGDCLAAFLIAGVITITVILILLIFVNFLTEHKKVIYSLAAFVGVVIFFITFIMNDRCDLSFLSGFKGYFFLGLTLLVIIAAIAWVVFSKYEKPEPYTKNSKPLELLEPLGKEKKKKEEEDEKDEEEDKDEKDSEDDDSK
ncbi:MAG: hypothetical protein ABIH37_00990 [archaeon]